MIQNKHRHSTTVFVLLKDTIPSIMGRNVILLVCINLNCDVSARGGILLAHSNEGRWR